MDEFGEEGGEKMDPGMAQATFQTLSAEGDLLLQKGSFHEAIEVYSKALVFRPSDKHCLVCRSRCYIQIGSPRKALADAEASLKDDPKYFKGLYQKAEALYAEGDFELALMYYHRGNRMRPELNEFRIGIQKSREAIDNSIGDPKAMQIKVPQKLRRNLAFLGHQVSHAMDTKEPTDAKPYFMSGHLTPAMESRLLGELYDDKVYLADLLSDRDFNEYPDAQVTELVEEGLRYLDTRVEFWRQQHPLYSRHKDIKKRSVKP